MINTVCVPEENTQNGEHSHQPASEKLEEQWRTLKQHFALYLQLKGAISKETFRRLPCFLLWWILKHFYYNILGRRALFMPSKPGWNDHLMAICCCRHIGSREPCPKGQTLQTERRANETGLNLPWQLLASSAQMKVEHCFQEELGGFHLPKVRHLWQLTPTCPHTLKAQRKSPFLLFWFFQPLHGESQERRSIQETDNLLTLLKLGDFTLAPSESLKAWLMANWIARPVIVPVESGSILRTACRSPALVW